MTQLSLSDRAEDLSAEDVPRYFKRRSFEDDLLRKLQDRATYLIDGCRGTGKTMLMRVAELQLDEKYRNKTSKLVAVFVRFPRAIALEGAIESSDQDFHPFRQWVFSKILKSTIEKLDTLESQKTTFRFEPIPDNISSRKLGDYITKLETIYRDPLAATLEHNASTLGLSPAWLRRVDKPDEMRSILVSLAQVMKIDGFIFLLDEVAQNLSQAHQNEFFSVIKHFRDPLLTCKVAVYPHVTSYGPDFEAGHDAIILNVERPVETDDYLDFFKEIVNQRTQGTALGTALSRHDEYLRLMIKACFGNPRALIHILARLPEKDSLQYHDVKNAIKEYIDEEQLRYLRNLKDRLRRLRDTVTVAEDALSLFLEDLRKINAVPGTRCLFVAISSQRSLPHKIHRAIDILVYAGLLARRGTVKITARESATRYLVNFGILIKENIIADPQGGKSNLSVSEVLERVSNPDRDRKKEYTRSAPDLLELIRKSDDQYCTPCDSCGEQLQPNHKFCPACGKALKRIGLYEELLAHPIDRLDITPGLMRILQESGRFSTVGAIVRATDEELDAVHKIGKIRTGIVRYAADEYLSA